MLSAMEISYRRYTDILLALFFVAFVLLAAAGSHYSSETEKPFHKTRYSYDDDNNNNNDFGYHYAQDFDPNVTEYWFRAVVDHFNFRPTSEPTFPLRYLVNDQYYQNSSSPVIFYAGNEANIMQFVKNSGFLFEAAESLGAMVVFAEHRYYGKSFPFGSPEAALTPYNISYLTVEQAMADFNTLQVLIRNKWRMSRDTAFIAAGGSYGANLALWLRLKNANLWAGALASSATPLKHLLRESNAFNRIVAEVYSNVTGGNDACPSKIRQGWKELFELLRSNSTGRDRVKQTLHLCEMPDDGNATGIAETIHGWISGGLETMVQYGYPYPTNFYNPVPAYPFREACMRMLTAPNGLEALYLATQVYYNYTGQAGECFSWLSASTTSDKNSFSSSLSSSSSESSVRNSHDRHWYRLGQIDRLHRKRGLEEEDYTDIAWQYQCCTEVYQPMPTNGVTDFEMPHKPSKIKYFERCQKRWEGVTPRPNWEEMTFWSSNIQAGSNIFLASGQLDPWRAAGIQSAPPGLPDSITIRIIENGAHHFDLRGSHPLDPPGVIQVREEELAAMRQWIVQWKEFYPATTGTSPASEDRPFGQLLNF